MFIFKLVEVIEIAEMAQLNPNLLMNCLTKGDHNWRYNDSDSDLDAVSAEKIRNTICRTVYGRLFTWIAGKINEALKVWTQINRTSHFNGSLI